MTKRPHDALFKSAFEHPPHAAELLRGCLPTPLAEAIAWDTIALEPGSFVDDELVDSHTDLLFSVDVHDARAFIYVLLEHQSKPDPSMPVRMNEYVARIWSRRLRETAVPRFPVVIPVVLTHAPGGWNAPVALWDLLEPNPDSIPGLAPHVPRFSILVQDLSAWNDEEIRQRVLAAFPRLALWVLRDAREPDRLHARLHLWTSALIEAAAAPNGITALAQLVHYAKLVLDAERYQQFRAKLRELAPDVERQVMTVLDLLQQQSHAEGRQQGRAEGRQQGRAEGQQSTLLKLLRGKFGLLDDADVAVVEQANTETLDRYLERILTADSVAAVLGG